ncbi:MAG: cupin domain-containing protein [Chloroflexota bacterium]|nr:cupin domain-containing protein [Chloroflexota bacterium]
MQAFDLDALRAAHAEVGDLYHEFLRAPSLSTGLYILRAGTRDPQQPHTEDEVYYVISGSGQITVADEDRAVRAGSIVFVATGVEHRFHTITEDLTILVFFAPARRSQATG